MGFGIQGLGYSLPKVPKVMFYLLNGDYRPKALFEAQGAVCWGLAFPLLDLDDMAHSIAKTLQDAV